MFKQITLFLNYFRDGYMTEDQLSSVLEKLTDQSIYRIFAE